jgi:hypothetical protein
MMLSSSASRAEGWEEPSFGARCTTSTRGRSFTLHELDAVLHAARRQAETRDIQNVYRQHRPMVERAIAWLVRGNRRLHCRGIIKNDWWFHHHVAAVNLQMMINLGLAHVDGGWSLTVPA